MTMQTIEVETSEMHLDVIESAAELLNITVEQFIIAASLESAERYIKLNTLNNQGE